ncbi:MAG: hypothetical protein QW303_00155 [Nitrososphaerota archaeon]
MTVNIGLLNPSTITIAKSSKDFLFFEKRQDETACVVSSVRLKENTDYEIVFTENKGEIIAAKLIEEDYRPHLIPAIVFKLLSFNENAEINVNYHINNNKIWICGISRYNSLPVNLDKKSETASRVKFTSCNSLEEIKRNFSLNQSQEIFYFDGLKIEPVKLINGKERFMMFNLNEGQVDSLEEEMNKCKLVMDIYNLIENRICEYDGIIFSVDEKSSVGAVFYVQYKRHI